MGPIFKLSSVHSVQLIDRWKKACGDDVTKNVIAKPIVLRENRTQSNAKRRTKHERMVVMSANRIWSYSCKGRWSGWICIISGVLWWTDDAQMKSLYARVNRIRSRDVTWFCYGFAREIFPINVRLGTKSSDVVKSNGQSPTVQRCRALSEKCELSIPSVVKLIRTSCTAAIDDRQTRWRDPRNISRVGVVCVAHRVR